jgi:MFS family permease
VLRTCCEWPRRVALHQLLDPSQHQFVPAYAGAIIAITVFGWGLGGLLGGVLADYLGRKRTTTLTIPARMVEHRRRCPCRAAQPRK